MELLALVFLSFCFLTLSGLTFAAEFEPTVVVKEGDSAILPCSLNTNVNIESALFDWKKVEQHSNKEVFLYDKADVYSNGRPGQVEQFKGRVSHFPEELEHGNASIRIENTKVADSGNYTCEFPRIQPEKIFHIELIVEPILKDRTDEKIPGAAPEPVVSILDGKGLLECRVKGAFPKPTVEWWDSSNKTVPSDKKEISEREHRFYITLQTTVSNTGRYRCVTTQEEIHHQISTDTFVALNEKMEPPTQGGTIYVMIGVIVVLVIFVVVAVYFAVRHNVPSVSQKDGVHEQAREDKDIPLVNTQSEQE